MTAKIFTNNFSTIGDGIGEENVESFTESGFVNHLCVLGRNSMRVRGFEGSRVRVTGDKMTENI